MYLFFFKQKTVYVMRISDWSSYVCSSDLLALTRGERFAEKVDRLLLVRPKLDHARPPRITSKRVRSSSCALPSLLTNSYYRIGHLHLHLHLHQGVSHSYLRSYYVRTRDDPSAWIQPHVLFCFSRERITIPSSGVFAKCDPVQSSRTPTRRSEEHTSELQSLMRISYAVFCLKKKNKQ